MEAETNNALLPLDQPRVIAIRDGKYSYTFTFDRITHADWERYFGGVQVTARNVSSGRQLSNNAESALLALAESKLIKVDGYSGDLMSKPDWQKRVWPKHMRPAATLLVQVEPSAAESDKPADADSMEVFLDAAWGPLSYKGLAHRFSPPTVDHKRAYLMAGSQSTIVGGSRDAITLYATRHKAVLKIYDELIQSVEGYSWSGAQLASVVEIRERMDAFHKVKAVEQLFEGGSDAAEEQIEGAA